jgi:hypothetical protein
LKRPAFPQSSSPGCSIRKSQMTEIDIAHIASARASPRVPTRPCCRSVRRRPSARAQWSVAEWRPISDKLTPRNDAVGPVLELGVAPNVRLLAPRFQVACSTVRCCPTALTLATTCDETEPEQPLWLFLCRTLDNMKLEQTSFISGNRNLLYPKIPFFLSRTRVP